MKEIALTISGNKRSNEGLQPVVLCGVAPEREARDEDTLVNENPSFIICHTTNYIRYTLQSNAVKSCDGNRSGRLIINLFIPSNKCLANKNSAYALLIEVYNAFLADCMSQSSDLYQFQSKEYDKKAFDEIIAKYPLEDFGGNYVNMKGAGKCIVTAETENKLEELFRDSQYPEFSNYSEVQVGKACTPTIQIGIPRCIDYKIYINGEYKKNVQDENEIITCKKTHPNPHKQYESLTFNLCDLFQAENNSILNEKGSVILDKKQGHIDCKLFTTDIIYDIQSEIIWDNDITEEDKLYLKKELKISLNNKDVSNDFFCRSKIQLIGSEHDAEFILNNKKIENGYNKFDISIKKFDRPFKVEITVIKHAKSHSEASSQKGGLTRNGQQPPKKINDNNNNSTQPVRITFKSKTLKRIFIRINEMDKETRTPDYYRQDLTLSKADAQNSIDSNFYSATINLDPSWKNKYVRFTIVDINNKTYKVQETLRDENSIRFEQHDFDRTFSFKVSYLIFLFVGILIGGSIVWFSPIKQENTILLKTQIDSFKTQIDSLKNIINSDETSSPNAKSAASAEEVSSPPSTAETTDQNAFNTYVNDLKSDDLTFGKVINIRNWLNDNNRKDTYQELDELVSAYETVIQCIKDVKFDKCDKNISDKLTKNQRESVVALYWGIPQINNTGQYNTNQKAEVNKLLKDKSFSSFKEINELIENNKNKIKKIR